MTTPTAMAAPHSLPLDDQKRLLRLQALAARNASADPSLGARVGRQILAHAALAPGSIVAGYRGMSPELDVSALLASWRQAGHVIALPRTPARGLPLTFHRWAEGDQLVRERFRTFTTDGPQVEPDLILVPLLAFDRRGHRLGYGGGYYDRTLAARPGVRTIGCARAASELAHVPAGATDIALDAIATETEFITIKG